jgi:hypothetical protein
MSQLRWILVGVLTISLASGGAALGQSIETEPAAKKPDAVSISAPTDSLRSASTRRLTDAAKQQVGRLAPARERRDQGWPPPPPPMPAWAAGMIAGLIVGGYAGLGIEGKRCHCESGKGLLVGAAIGGSGGGLLVWRLTR